MKKSTKIVVYKVAALLLVVAAAVVFINAWLIYAPVAHLPITDVNCKIGVTLAVLRCAGGLLLGFIAFLFNYSANLHKRDGKWKQAE